MTARTAVLTMCAMMAFAGPARPALAQPPAETKCTATTPEFHEGTQARFERFNEISKAGEAQLVFLGDSITEGWEGAGKEVWASRYTPRKAANFGIGGDRTEHVLWRLDHGNFDGLKPRLIVIMIGTNNAGHRQEAPADTAAGIRAILDRLRAKCPDSRILLLGIFPRGEKTDDPLRKINERTNAIIQSYADGERIVYKDIGDKFLDSKGVLSKEIMPDLLHLSPQGYGIWADAIEEDVKRLMAE
ncbi:MAG: GDSL family lipase [Phycisphaerales bacterium]|nr:GDSL family lipase [Phycisphaerales bacterium]